MPDSSSIQKLKKCIICGGDIRDIRGKQSDHCSDKCKKRHKKILNPPVNHNITSKMNLRTGEIGQICEYLVLIDLIKQGYYVYRPFDTTCKHDLLAFKNNKYIKVQVKAGRYTTAKTKVMPKIKNDDYDLLAIVYNLNEIIYHNKTI